MRVLKCGHKFHKGVRIVSDCLPSILKIKMETGGGGGVSLVIPISCVNLHIQCSLACVKTVFGKGEGFWTRVSKAV